MTEALPDKIVPGDPVSHPTRGTRHAYEEGRIDGWNAAIDACERALEAKGAPEPVAYYDPDDGNPSKAFAFGDDSTRGDRYRVPLYLGAPQVAPEPGTEPPAMHLASVIETVADLLERSGNAKLGASLLRDGLKERKRRDGAQVAPELPAPQPVAEVRLGLDEAPAIYTMSVKTRVGSVIQDSGQWRLANFTSPAALEVLPLGTKLYAGAPQAVIGAPDLLDRFEINETQGEPYVYPTARSGQGPEADLSNIESPFNACMHREHCLGWKRIATSDHADPTALQSLLEELRIQCSWLTGADYSNAMTLLDRIETALHQSETPTSSMTSEPAQAGAVQRPVGTNRDSR